jgi:hypothetical protein
MEFTDWLIWKAVALVVAAFFWGIYCGLTGRPLSLEPNEEEAAESQDRPTSR